MAEIAQVTLALQDKYEQIEAALVDASQFEKVARKAFLTEDSLLDQLTDERKAIPIAEVGRRTEISKRIRKKQRRRKK